MKKPLLIILFILLAMIGYAIADSIPDDTAVTGEQTDSGYQSDVLLLDITGDIGTVTADRVIGAVNQAEDESADLLVIIMDTPGGFVSATWDITRAIMNSRVPVAVYISPVGARAGSAGVFITYSAHIAAMAPSTNIGAAHVVSPETSDSVMMEKTQNDAVASIKAMAERHGRNAEWAEKAVRESVSITNKEALEIGVVDIVADNLDDLLATIDGREVVMAHGTQKIHSADPVTKTISRTFIQTILEMLSSPNLVFLLFSLGSLGIAMEIYNPGSVFPGVVGGICLILAFYGTRMLPINYAGVLFILFSIILFILEIKVVSHGILTIGGVIALIIGGMMLIDTSDPELKVSKTVIFSTALVVGAFVAFAFYYVYKARISRPSTGSEGLIGKTGVVKTKIEKHGYVYLNGELWEATSDELIEEGEEVEVLEVHDLKMKVKRKLQ